MKRVALAFAFALSAAACGSNATDGVSETAGSAGLAAGAASGAGGSAAGAGGGANAPGAAGGHGDAGTPGSSGGGAGGASCAASSSALAAWPGGSDVKAVDVAAQFDGNLSGLSYEAQNGAAPAVLWAASNLPGTLYRLIHDGESFVTDAANGWSDGKRLHYPGGAGEPDSEGVTLGETSAAGVYVVSEHDNDDAGTSRGSVLRYDVSVVGSELTATHEWDLTAALPTFGANTGLEAVTWIADDYLTSRGFFDEAKAHVYLPSEYPGHGSGLFFVGVEETGKIYGFALDHVGGGSKLLASVATPNAGVMGLEMDRDVGLLWAYCDETCDNLASVFDIDVTPGSPMRGRFVLRRQFERPVGLPDSNNEGIALGPEAECQAGLKPFFWADDADRDGQSIRQGTLRCGACL